MKKGWIQADKDGAYEDLAPSTLADQVYMDESQTQTVKEAMAGLGSSGGGGIARPENLLINPIRPGLLINQRGKAMYDTPGEYTIDRWKLIHGRLHVYEGHTQLFGQMRQIVENGWMYNGEIVTASSDCGLISINGSAFGNPVTIKVETGELYVDVQAQGDFHTVQLVLGDSPTPVKIPFAGDEMARCQRYFQRVWIEAAPLHIRGTCNAINEMTGEVIVFDGTPVDDVFSIRTLPVALRDRPNISWPDYNNQGVHLDYRDNNSMFLSVSGHDHICTTALLDAELYN